MRLRVKAGMRRAKLEGRRIGRAPLGIDREQVVSDRLSGMSLNPSRQETQNFKGQRLQVDEGKERFDSGH